MNKGTRKGLGTERKNETTVTEMSRKNNIIRVKDK